MGRDRTVLKGLVLSLLCVVGCGSGATGALSKEEAIDIAAHHLMGKSFERAPPAEVRFEGGVYTVVFTYPVPGGRPGETYRKKVVFDAQTREVLEIEMIVDEAGDSSAQAAQGYRETPLREEVDQLGPVRDRVLGGTRR